MKIWGLIFFYISNDTQNAGFYFNFFKIKPPQTGSMLPVSLSDGAINLSFGAMINLMQAAKLSIYSKTLFHTQQKAQ